MQAVCRLGPPQWCEITGLLGLPLLAGRALVASERRRVSRAYDASNKAPRKLEQLSVLDRRTAELSH